MTPHERKTKLEAIARLIQEAMDELEPLQPELTYDIDKRAVTRILTQMAWAVENCTVVGLHQIGEALDDTMGYGTDGIAQ